MNRFISFLTMAAGAYALLVLLLFIFQAHLLYFPNTPSRALSVGPDSIGLAYEDVELVSEDGIKLHAWFVPAPEARGTVIFFHGNAGNISHRLDSLKIFHDVKLSTLIIDYRGYGRSEGKPSEQGTYSDADAAWRYLTEQRGIPASSIILFGRSFGGAIAAYLASRQKPAGLIIESGFVSVPDLAPQIYPWLPARQLARFSYPTGEYVKSAALPVLIIHSRYDEVIPYSQGQSLFAAAREPKHFLELRGGHNDGFIASGRHYLDGLNRFLTNVLSK